MTRSHEAQSSIINPLSSSVVTAAATQPVETGFVADLMALAKARLSALVLVTTLVGFLMASAGGIDWLRLLHTMLGTGLVTASAAILNQLMESKVDLLMERTRDRPLPAGRLQPATALVLGYLGAAIGFCYLFTFVNLTAAYLAALTLVIYLFLYTPLKRITSLCVALGAVSGALPPMIGAAAASPAIGPIAWILFGVLFFWQMPHFLALAWMYRDDYTTGGFVMLPRWDKGGRFTASVALLCALALAAITLLPFALALVHPLYLPGALLLDAMFLICAIGFLRKRTGPIARRLFLASIIYLPALLTLMVATKK